MKYNREGQLLLVLFREEQLRRGNKGCFCNDCKVDMIEAYTTFRKNEDR